jgi:hypothetical protein
MIFLCINKKNKQTNKTGNSTINKTLICKILGVHSQQHIMSAEATKLHLNKNPGNSTMNKTQIFKSLEQ